MFRRHFLLYQSLVEVRPRDPPSWRYAAQAASLHVGQYAIVVLVAQNVPNEMVLVSGIDQHGISACGARRNREVREASDVSG